MCHCKPWRGLHWLLPCRWPVSLRKLKRNEAGPVAPEIMLGAVLR